MQIKPIAAGVAAGAVLAAGGFAAVQFGTPQADAQSGSSLQAQINQLKTAQEATDKRSIVAGKKGNNAWNGTNRYTADQGTPPPNLQSPKVSQQGTVSGGWQPKSLDDDVQANWPYWVKNYYNGTTNTWTGRGVTSVVRTAVGEYTVNYGKPIAGCAYTVTPGYYNGGSPDKYAIAQVYNGTAPTNVVVKTYSAGAGGADVTAKDYPWQGELVCNPSTASSTP